MSLVKVLHWNVLYQEKAENVLALVKELNPDILCCQELTEDRTYNPNVDIVRELGRLFKSHYYEPANISGAGGEELDLGNGIFSKYPIKSKRKVVLWDGRNDELGNAQEKRIYVEVQIDVNGRQLTVGTTHLSFFPKFEMSPDRRREADILFRAIRNHKTNFILTGDFNSAPDTYTIKRLEKYYKSAGPPHTEPTFTTIPFEYMGFRATGLDWRVDYIFVSPDIKVASSKIVKTEFSDHLPILAELKL